MIIRNTHYSVVMAIHAYSWIFIQISIDQPMTMKYISIFVHVSEPRKLLKNRFMNVTEGEKKKTSRREMRGEFCFISNIIKTIGVYAVLRFPNLSEYIRDTCDICNISLPTYQLHVHLHIPSADKGKVEMNSSILTVTVNINHQLEILCVRLCCQVTS